MKNKSKTKKKLILKKNKLKKVENKDSFRLTDKVYIPTSNFPFVFIQDSTIDIPSVTSLMLFVPYCSFKCVYCYNKENMLSFAKKIHTEGLDLKFPRNYLLAFFNYIVDKVDLEKDTLEPYFKFLLGQHVLYKYILFSGGEPLDNWESVEKITDFIDRYNQYIKNTHQDKWGSLYIGIQTTAYKKDILYDWIKKYSNTVRFLHIDFKTDKAHMSLYRSNLPDTYIDSIIDFIEQIQQEFPDIEIVAKHVVVDKFYENAVSFAQNVIYPLFKRTGIVMQFQEIQHYELQPIENRVNIYKEEEVKELKTKEDIQKALFPQYEERELYYTLPSEEGLKEVSTSYAMFHFYKNFVAYLQDFASKLQSRDFPEEILQKLLNNAQKQRKFYLEFEQARQAQQINHEVVQYNLTDVLNSPINRQLYEDYKKAHNIE